MKASTKILYLEDEWSLGRIVKESLASRGYDIQLVENGSAFMNEFHQFQPNICLLDVMVPNIDGLTIGEMIREVDQKIPIIFLTAKSQSSDVLRGFESGGNDYIKKPFSMEELIVRIENLLQLTSSDNSNTKEVIQLGNYAYNHDKFELEFKGEIQKLSHKENEILYLFSIQKNKQIDRRLILNKIWGNDSIYNSRTLDVYVKKLRNFFDKDPQIKIITLRGIGYFFSVEE